MICVVCKTKMDRLVEDLHECPKCCLVTSDLKPDPMIYNAEYYEKYKKYAKTQLGKDINQARWDFVMDHIDGGLLLDYGCGAGHFLQMNPNGTFMVQGYDINPASIYSYMEPLKDITYQGITFWDVLEHMRDPLDGLLKYKAEWVFMTVPNFVNVPDDVKKFKHYWPREHTHQFREESLVYLLEKVGFSVVSITDIEGRLRSPENPEWLMTVAAKKGA